MDQDRETFELSITPRMLVGLRNALLEGITDGAPAYPATSPKIVDV
jgi:hypothetical protein